MYIFNIKNEMHYILQFYRFFSCTQHIFPRIPPICCDGDRDIGRNSRNRKQGTERAQKTSKNYPLIQTNKYKLEKKELLLFLNIFISVCLTCLSSHNSTTSEILWKTFILWIVFALVNNKCYSTYNHHYNHHLPGVKLIYLFSVIVSHTP